MCEHSAGARSSYHAATPPWSPSQPPTAANSPDRGASQTGQAMYGSMLGSLHMTQQQPGSAAHMASQLQLTASQLGAPPDPAAQNPLACRQLMLQVRLSCIVLPLVLLKQDCQLLLFRCAGPAWSLCSCCIAVSCWLLAFLGCCNSWLESCTVGCSGCPPNGYYWVDTIYQS